MYTPAQRNTAYTLGKTFAAQQTQTAQANIDSLVGDKAVRTGKVTRLFGDAGLTSRQSISIEGLEKVVSEITNSNVYLYETVADGNSRKLTHDIPGFAKFTQGSVAPNGFYDPKTGSIYIDVNAGNSGEGVILWTAAHELTHFVKDWSPTRYKALADFLTSEYGKSGKSVDELVSEQQNKAKSHGRSITYDEAFDEVIADSMQTMFTDTNLAEKLAKLKKTDRGLWEKLKAKIKEWYAKVTKQYKKLDPQSEEAKLVRQMKDSLEKISDMFAEALVDAGENYSKAEQKNNASEGVKFDARSFTEDKYFQRQINKWQDLSAGSYVVVGTINDGSALNQVGFKSGKLYFDVTKIKAEMEKHGDHLSVGIMKRIPEMLNDPIVIAEYKPGENTNTVNVYGNLYYKNTPITVGIVATVGRSGNTITKVRTTHARSNFERQISDESVLYLNENKKETNRWFQAQGQRVPMGGTKYGFIRSIQLNLDSVNPSTEKLSARTPQNAEIDEKELEAINKSGLSEEEYFIKKAVDEFGYTPYFYDAGYITPNGRMLNFSGEKGRHFSSRGEDHRAVAVLFEVTEGSEALVRFMKYGNVRIMPETPGIDLSNVKEPTPEQYSTIRRFAEKSVKDEFFSIDISDEMGNNIGELTYEDNINPTRIINDIKHYYATGEIREQSTVDRFRYSPRTQRDADYMKAVESGDMETAQRMVDEAAKAAGYTEKMYHGSRKSADIKVFRDWQYFTHNKEYAQRYADKKLYTAYVKAENWFDTRNADAKALFEEARSEYGLGELQENGLPDWTDGYDLSEFIEDNGYDYDGIILHEGGDMVNGKPVMRGNSYVVKKSAQIKSADLVTYDDEGNVSPLSERFNEEKENIRYSDRDGGLGNGYDGYSMSNNARDAYNAGEKPLSKWTKSEILSAVAKLDTEKANKLKTVKADVLRSRLLTWTAWHHTSSMYNQTDFYAVDEDIVDSLTDTEIAEWAKETTAKPVAKNYKGDINYIVWEGSKKHPKATKRSLTNVNIEERGSFYIVSDDTGNEILRKKIGSNGTSVVNYAERDAREKAWEKARADRLKPYEDNSSKAAYDFYNSNENMEYSSSDHIYKQGRKPSWYDYELGVENFFVKGEQRLYDDTENKRFILETWDGSQWVSEDEGNLRSSDRDIASTDSRTLLSDALMSAAIDDMERNKIAEYQKNIEAMNAEQTKLSQLRAEIKEITRKDTANKRLGSRESRQK